MQTMGNSMRSLNKSVVKDIFETTKENWLYPRYPIKQLLNKNYLQNYYIKIIT
jgi:hypothetical protein